MKYFDSLQQKTKEQIINELYNEKIAHLTDYNGEERITLDKYGYGKRIPYIGWFWRITDFADKRITIGDCGDFVGVMENNKWEYPEREMTTEEVNKFIEYLERGFTERKKIGVSAETIYHELWDWFQTLRHTGDWAGGNA